MSFNKVKHNILCSNLPFLDSPDGGLPALVKSAPGIEIMAEGLFWCKRREAMTALRKLLEGYGRPLTLHAPFYNLNLAAAGYPELRKWTVSVYVDYLQLAQEIGATYVVIHPFEQAVPCFCPHESRKLAREGISQLAREAVRREMTVAVENVGTGEHSLFYNEEEFFALYQGIPGVMTLLDVGHAFLNGWDIPGVIRHLGRDLAGVHLHDNKGREDEHLPLKMGVIDWEPILDALAEAEHPLQLVLEYGPGSPLERMLKDAGWLGERFL